MIYHPQSPFKGQRYPHPVELIDIFPTLNDLLGAKFDRATLYPFRKYVPLQGKSLAPIILGKQFQSRYKRTNSLVNYPFGVNKMPYLNQTFAITQTWRCADVEDGYKDPRTDSTVPRTHKPWEVCSVKATRSKSFNISSEISLMGYSMRTLDFRYTTYIHFHRLHLLPELTKPLYAEELYDHRGEKVGDLGSRELINLAGDPNYADVLKKYRTDMILFLYKDVVYRDIATTLQFHERRTNKLIKMH